VTDTRRSNRLPLRAHGVDRDQPWLQSRSARQRSAIARALLAHADRHQPQADTPP
jgi:hypothetical protein